MRFMFRDIFLNQLRHKNQRAVRIVVAWTEEAAPGGWETAQ